MDFKEEPPVRTWLKPSNFSCITSNEHSWNIQLYHVKTKPLHMIFPLKRPFRNQGFPSHGPIFCPFRSRPPPAKVGCAVIIAASAMDFDRWERIDCSYTSDGVILSPHLFHDFHVADLRPLLLINCRLRVVLICCFSVAIGIEKSIDRHKYVINK